MGDRSRRSGVNELNGSVREGDEEVALDDAVEGGQEPTEGDGPEADGSRKASAKSQKKKPSNGKAAEKTKDLSKDNSKIIIKSFNII